MHSRLGFGTSGIMGASLTTRGRLRLLETAWGEGIRHFDTAPLYGLGEAEALLGRFLRGRRDTVSLTTKFGLLPASPPRLLRPMLPLARGVNRRLLPPLRSGLARITGGAPAARRQKPQPAARREGSGSPAAAGAEACSAVVPHQPRQPPIAYTAAMLRQQLEASLRNLETDHIDYYLLHEGHADYLNPSFIECLDQLVSEGKILHYGVGTGRWQCRCLVEAFPQQRWVLQIPDTLLDQDTAWFAQHSAGPLFTHSALRLDLEGSAPALQDLLTSWSSLTGRRADDPALPGELLLALALQRNPHGCVIFSSRNPARIRANAAIPDSTMLLKATAASLLPQDDRQTDLSPSA